MLKVFTSLFGLFIAWQLAKDACETIMHPHQFLAAEGVLIRNPEIAILLDIEQVILIVLFLTTALAKNTRAQWFAFAAIIAFCILLLVIESWYNTLTGG